MNDGISFKAVVTKVATLKDGGFTVTLGVPESERTQTKELMDVVNSIVVQVAVVPHPEQSYATT